VCVNRKSFKINVDAKKNLHYGALFGQSAGGCDFWRRLSGQFQFELLEKKLKVDLGLGVTRKG
jgi:hypothetical protein